MTQTLKKNIGNQVKEKRIALNLSVEEIVNELNISEETYTEIERGNDLIPLSIYEDYLIHLINYSLSQFKHSYNL